MTNAYPKAFRNENKFQDDIWGEINLNYLECDVVDTPEFQRLFRTSQLGFVDLVYHSANHTRGTHSIRCLQSRRVANDALDGKYSAWTNP